MKNIQVKKPKTDRKYVNILGTNILSITERELLTAIEEKITHSSKLGSRNIKFSILTPNPELVLASTKNIKLKEALNSATFSIPDGVGLSYASKFLYKTPLNIISGRILFLKLIEMAVNNDWKVFLLGGEGNEAVLAAENLITKYPTIIISTSKGSQLNKNGEPDTKVDKKIQSDVVERINMLKPDLLFVAFGNPKQEIWIHNNLSKLNVGGAMSVGGTFRYLAGIAPLPPKWMENLGLEWLWRLITEPKRIIRIWNAVILFPLKVFWNKIRS